VYVLTAGGDRSQQTRLVGAEYQTCLSKASTQNTEHAAAPVFSAYDHDREDRGGVLGADQGCLRAAPHQPVHPASPKERLWPPPGWHPLAANKPDRNRHHFVEH